MAQTTILGRLTVTNAAAIKGGVTECLITILAATTVHEDAFTLSLMHPDPENPLLPGANFPPMTLNVGQTGTLYYQAEMAESSPGTPLRINYMIDAMVDGKKIAKDGYLALSVARPENEQAATVTLDVDFDGETPQSVKRAVPRNGAPQSFDLSIDITGSEDESACSLLMTIDGGELKFSLD